MSQLTHREDVCQLYRKCLRLAFDWISNRKSHRNFVLAVRRQFDLNKSEHNLEKIAHLKDATRYLLWKYRHPEPYIYPTAPGGVAYDREPKFSPEYVRDGYNEKLESY